MFHRFYDLFALRSLLYLDQIFLINGSKYTKDESLKSLRLGQPSNIFTIPNERESFARNFDLNFLRNYLVYFRI